MNAHQQPLLVSSTVYLAVALKCACLTAFGQAVVLPFRVIDPHFVFYCGWLFIFGYTVYRFGQMNARSLVVNDTALVQFLGCVGAIAISAAYLYGATIALDNPDSNQPSWQIKAVFIINPFVALAVASVLMAATFSAARIREMFDQLKS